MNNVKVTTPSGRTLSDEFAKTFDAIRGLDRLPVTDIMKMTPFKNFDGPQWEEKAVQNLAVAMLLTESPFSMCIHWDNIPDSYHVGDASILYTISGDGEIDPGLSVVTLEWDDSEELIRFRDSGKTVDLRDYNDNYENCQDPVLGRLYMDSYTIEGPTDGKWCVTVENFSRCFDYQEEAEFAVYMFSKLQQEGEN